MSLPTEIHPSETLLRSLRKRDVNRGLGTIKVGALKPGGARTELSLIRGRIGAVEAREAAIEHVHGSEFWVFGEASAKSLAPHAISILDDPETFIGHANMDLGYSLPAGPPNTPAEMTAAYEIAMTKLKLLAQTFALNLNPTAAPPL